MTDQEIVQYILDNGSAGTLVSIDDGDAENGPGPVRVSYYVRLGRLVLHAGDKSDAAYLEYDADPAHPWGRFVSKPVGGATTLADEIRKRAEATKRQHVDVY